MPKARTGFSPDAEYARRMRSTSPGNIATYAHQNDTAAPRDVFALAASDGRYDSAALISLFQDVQQGRGVDGQEEVASGCAPKPLLALAKLLASQAYSGEDESSAILIYKTVIRFHGAKAMRWDDRLVFLELLAAKKWVTDLDKYLRLLKLPTHDRNQSVLLAANARNPFVLGNEDQSEGRVQEWLKRVNAVFASDGLEPIGIAPGAESPLDRIISAPASFVEDGPMVTVIVPTYDPGPRIATAIESLISQSYLNLEILVMDDATPADSAQALDSWTSRDPRIRVIHLPENAGTYRARNIAVSEYAHGEYITVHDDDDWSHPRKIEMQVRHLLENPDEVANVSMLSRTTNLIQFARINNNAVFTQKNYSSLMLRRSAFEQLGYWDIVNRSADAEMFDRIVAVSGRPISAVCASPLSFLRVREASLTSGEIHKGYIDARRTWYQRLSRAWHAAELENGAIPHIALNPSARRPFPAPLGMIGSKQRTVTHSFDVVYATDFRFPGGNSSLALREIQTLLEAEYRVAILQMDSPLLGPKNSLHAGLHELIKRFDLPIVSLLDEVRSRLTIVRHPTVLQYVAQRRSQHETDRLVVIVNHAPHETDFSRSLYEMDDVIHNVRAVFGAEPLIAPESGLIRTLLGPIVEPSLLTSFNWEGIVDGIEGRLRRSDLSRCPVIGRHSRDAPQKWPSAELLPQVYPLDGSMDIRVLGGAEAARQGIGSAVDAWTIYPFGSISANDFLRDVDFWVYFHSDALHESFGMATAEALAAGAVTILPSYMEATFGSGALYCDASEVQDLIWELWGDDERYRDQSRQAMAYASARFGKRALEKRIKDLLES